MPRDVHAFEIQHHGNKRWRVLVPAELRKDGPAKRIFSSKAKADSFARDLNSGRSGWSGRLLAFSYEDQGRIVRAIERAGGAEQLELAVDAWVKTRVTEQVSVRRAATECVESKRGAGRSWRYVENLEVALRSFRLSRESVSVSDITTKDIESWLNGNGWSASTRQTYLRRLETFWGFAIKRGYAVTNPTAAIDTPTAENRAPRILNVDQVKTLLETCRAVDAGLVPYFALALFAGIRPEEIRRLTWGRVKAGHIEIEAAKAKTRRRRLVEIHPTLAEWLKLGGDMPPTNWRRRWRAVVEKSEIKWSSDVMRHTYCSYSLPINGEIKTAANAGNSVAVLMRDYRELVTRAEAERFWAIIPAPLAKKLTPVELS